VDPNQPVNNNQDTPAVQPPESAGAAPMQPTMDAQPPMPPLPSLPPTQPAGEQTMQPQPMPMDQPMQPTPMQGMPMGPAQPMSPGGFGAPYQQPMSSSQLSGSGSGRKKIIIIAVAVVAGLAVLGIGASLVFKKGSNPITNIVNSVKGGSEVVDRSDGTLDLSDLVDKQGSIANQDVKAKLKQQVNLKDGTSYMVTAVERNWTSTSRYTKAAAGKELIKVSMVVGNKSKEGQVYVSSSMFKVKNSAGGLQSAEFISKTDLAEALQGQDISPGKQAKGVLIFEVDKDEKVSAIVTEVKYDNYTTKEVVTIKSEVSLL